LATRTEGIAVLVEVHDELVACARGTAADLRAYGLPRPVFGVFDGVQWILFAAAHTDNHVPQLRALRAHRDVSSQGLDRWTRIRAWEACRPTSRCSGLPRASAVRAAELDANRGRLARGRS
jgi:hypothetical protein